jgi:hypothetical protein
MVYVCDLLFPQCHSQNHVHYSRTTFPDIHAYYCMYRVSSLIVMQSLTMRKMARATVEHFPLISPYIAE